MQVNLETLAPEQVVENGQNCRPITGPPRPREQLDRLGKRLQQSLGNRRLAVARVPDGRLFRNAAGNYIEAAAYGITWGRAGEATLTLDEHALALAKRPSGVDPAECARRAGQSIQVLFRYYAKFLAEARNPPTR